jgi:hypothetical protein
VSSVLCSGAADLTPDGVTLLTALQEQLGLRLPGDQRASRSIGDRSSRAAHTGLEQPPFDALRSLFVISVSSS